MALLKVNHLTGLGRKLPQPNSTPAVEAGPVDDMTRVFQRVGGAAAGWLADRTGQVAASAPATTSRRPIPSSKPALRPH
jgi:hypothetical protein